MPILQILTILLFPAILLILIKKHYEVTVTKKLFEKLKNKFINFCKWVWSECKDWHTLVLFAIVVVLMYAPVWLGYILYFVFKSKWAMGVASAYLVFWAGPFTPYFPLCIAITLSLKKLIEKIKLQRDSIYNALNLTPAQIKCKNEIEKKRFEALESELKKFCLVKKKLKRAEEKCNKLEIANAEKELKPIRKCIRKISSEYDKQFMEILNSEQKAKYRMIRRLKRNDLKKQHKIQKNGQKPSDLKPFGEKISQPAYAEQKHNQTCLWHKMIKKIKKK